MNTTIKWEVQQLVDGKWVNLWTSDLEGATIPLQFDSAKEAGDELLTHLKEADDDGVPLNAAEYRVMDVQVHDPAPLYEVGYTFNFRLEGVVRKAVLTERYHNGDVWRYHMGLCLGLKGDTPPDWVRGARVRELETEGDTLLYCDWTTIDEYQVASHRIPAEGEPPMFVRVSGFGAMAEYWNETMGWVNRSCATAYPDPDKVAIMGGRWEQIK